MQRSDLSIERSSPALALADQVEHQTTEAIQSTWLTGGMTMRLIPVIALFSMLTVAPCASAQQYAGYVCEATLVVPTSTPYGAHGYLQVKLTSSSKCLGASVPGVALYHLTEGANVQGVAASYLLTEVQLMTLLHAYSSAAARQQKVRINTNTFGGGLQIQGVTFLSN